MEQIAQLISSYGFPIICCLYMWRYINTTHKELTDAINQMNALIGRLMEKMGGGENP